MSRRAPKRPKTARPGGGSVRARLASIAALVPAIAVVVMALILCTAAVALGIAALPVVILFADLLAFLHLRLLALERKREAASETAAFRAAALDLAPVKEPHRARLTPAQIPLPFNQWVADVRAGQHP